MTVLSAPAEVWALGASSVLRLFDGGRRRAELAKARAELRERAAEYRSTVMRALSEAEDALAASLDLKEEEIRQARSLAAAARTTAAAERRYRVGFASWLEVADAQQAELEAELGLTQIRARRFDAAVTLVKALGGGWRVPGANPVVGDRVGQ